MGNISFFLTQTSAILRKDSSALMREPLISVLPIAPFLAAVAFRILLPILESFLNSRFGFDLEAWYWLIGAFLIQFPPMFFGMIAGFLILEEREEGILQTLSITPTGKVRFFVIRMGFISLLSAIVSLLILPIVGIPHPGFLIVLPLSFVSALLAPIFALLLCGFADNRIEGLATGKLLGLIDLIPLTLFLPMPYRATAWPFAPYWITVSYGSAMGMHNIKAAVPGPYGALSIALCSAAALLVLLLVLFRKKLE